MVDLLDIREAFRSLGVIVILLITHSVLISFDGCALQSYVVLEFLSHEELAIPMEEKIVQKFGNVPYPTDVKKKNSSFSSNMNNN